jgi:hypothetical protein
VKAPSSAWLARHTFRHTSNIPLKRRDTFGYTSGYTFGILLGYFGDTLWTDTFSGILFGYVGDTFWILCGYFGYICWINVEEMHLAQFGYFGDTFGILLGYFWDTFGIIKVSRGFWWIVRASCFVYQGYFLDTFRILLVLHLGYF